jgi:predicted amidohydrolase YtcJ
MLRIEAIRGSFPDRGRGGHLFQRHLSFLSLALIVWPAVARLAAQPAPPDTILFNGKIVTVDSKFSYGQAIAIGGGKVLAVGSNNEVRALRGSQTREIDLHGKTVIPGLMDNHLHAAGGGPGVDLSGARTLKDLLDAIASRAHESKPGELVVTNGDWHEAQLKEQRLPLRRDLDRAAPNNPVVVVRGGHEYILNSKALEKWGIAKETPEPPGGAISRYDDGELNGELMDRAKALVRLPEPEPKDLEARIREQQEEYRKLNAAGLTTVRHPGAPVEQYRMLQEMERRHLLTMRVNFLIRLFDARDAEGVRKTVASWNVRPDEGDDWLRIGGVKLGVDGGFEGGWMREPYAEPYGKGGKFFGLETIPRDAYIMVVKEVNRLGWRVSTHAVGDAAIDLVLDAYQAASSEKPIADRRWTIEHGFIPRPEHLARINRLGVLVTAQDHLYLAAPSLKKYWGEKRAGWVTPVRFYLDGGVKVSAGTDSPVVPYPPLWVIYHFVTRNTISDGVYGKDQRITRQEALRLSTINNAYLTFEEKTKGSLEPGKLADLVVLSDDLMTCPEEKIRDMTVLATMVDGKFVYQHKDFRP